MIPTPPLLPPLCEFSLSLQAIQNGLKFNEKRNKQATLSNPNVSDGAKKNAQEMLDKLGGEDAFMKNNGKGE